jgi:hypothetical protein
MRTFNPIATQIALAQEVEIGSQEWINGGLHPFSGQTGDHPAYGWKRPEEMTSARVRAVISNYAARGCWYAEEPYRESGYNIGGRPVGWKPEDGFDLPGGERGYLTESGFVAVSGPDVQHFWADPLFDIIDRAPDSLMVPAQSGMMQASKLARIMSMLLIDTMAGMVRHHGKFWGGGRTFARIVDTFVQGSKRNVVSQESADALLHWVDAYGLPALEKAPGVSYAKGMQQFNIYQGLSWVLPAVYDAANAIEDQHPIKSRLLSVQNRLAQWVLDIDSIKGGRGAWEHCKITKAMEEGQDGAPLPTLIGAVDASDIGGPEWYGDWAVRAADITAHLIPGEHSKDYRQRVINSVKNPELHQNKKWMVDKDRNFITAE